MFKMVRRGVRDTGPDIYIPPTEGSIVGHVPGLNGREAAEEVIAKLLRKKLYHSKAWLQLQRSKGKSVAEIASECKVSTQIINTYLRKFNLS